MHLQHAELQASLGTCQSSIIFNHLLASFMWFSVRNYEGKFQFKNTFLMRDIIDTY